VCVCACVCVLVCVVAVQATLQAAFVLWVSKCRDQQPVLDDRLGLSTDAIAPAYALLVLYVKCYIIVKILELR
jgi:hypothetical protein